MAFYFQAVNTILPDFVYPPDTSIPVDDSTGPLVWVFLGAYLCFLLCIAAYGFAKTMGLCGLKKVAADDGLKDHFVANRSLGYMVLTLTVFATVYSGYTVVGVPGEVWSAGLFGFRWFLTPIIMFCPMAMINSRLQYLSSERDYISPIGFISDRWKSRELTTLCALVMAFPAAVYAMSQFKSMGETVEALSDGKIEAFDAASTFCAIMVLYEVFGGMRAIAWTDALQGGILFLGFILFFIVQWEFFGGIEPSALKWNYMATEGLQLFPPPAPKTVFPPGITMLSKWQLESWFTFAFTLFWSFGFYPHMVLRFQAAKSASVLKFSNTVQPIGHCVVMLGSIFTGMIAYRWFPYAIPECFIGDTAAPGCLSNDEAKGMIFGKVVRRAIQENLGYNILGSMMLAASVAAFMSTADSAIHATSSLITMDIFKPIFSAEYYSCGPCGLLKQETILLFLGKVVSLGVAIFALFSSKIDMSLSALLITQGAVLMQIAPAFWLGFYKTGVKAHAVLLGLIAGVTISIYYQCYEDPTGDGRCIRSPAYTSWYEPIDGIHPAVFGFIVNVATCLVVSVIPVGHLRLCRIAGDEIPDSMLAWNADGDRRPWRSMPWCFVWWGGVLLCTFTTPWWNSDAWEVVPEPMGGEPAKLFMGLPEWIWHCGAFGVAGIFCIVTSLIFGWSDDASPQKTVAVDDSPAYNAEEGTNDAEEGDAVTSGQTGEDTQRSVELVQTQGAVEEQDYTKGGPRSAMI